ncbi:MAG TPA: preprotein translocase subunit SecG [Chitinivibrionales bacterium]
MLFGIVVFIFVVVCILLCCLVLIQNDKGGGISGAIGGGLAGASSMFGTQDTANVLTKLTTGFAAAFMGLCIIMSLFLSHPTGNQVKSQLKERAEKQQNFSPASALQGQQGLPLAPKGGQMAPAQGGQGATQQQAPTGGLPMAPAKAPAGKTK